MRSVPSLNTLLMYENPAVLLDYCQQHTGVSLEHAKQIFHDLLGWLWISLKRLEKQQHTHMIGSLKRLDDMWHVFILHTKSYTAFCDTYFGAYFHHEPEPQENAYAISAEELGEFLSDCYDYLGENWVRRNFADLID